MERYVRAQLVNFYPRPPRGGRPLLCVPSSYFKGKFLSTPSARRATILGRGLRFWSGDFYPRPPRGGRPFHGGSNNAQGLISIHALREEGDDWGSSRRPAGRDFYPRPPRGGRRLTCWSCALLTYFYPRPPRGGRLPSTYTDYLNLIFLSTPSARRATSQTAAMKYNTSISIHALREEGDWRTPRPVKALRYFYPRPPRGGRQCDSGLSCFVILDFYPRPPRGGRPASLGRLKQGAKISIHALREEGDFCSKSVIF